MQNIITHLVLDHAFLLTAFVVLITSWPKTNWKGTCNTRNLILTTNPQCLRPFFTVVFCLNFSSQFDYLLYFSVSCFHISSLLKYEPDTDFLEFANGSVCQAVPHSKSGPSPLCTDSCRMLVKTQEIESHSSVLAIQSVTLTTSQGHRGPQFRVWTQSGLCIPLLGSSFEVCILLTLLTFPPTWSLLHFWQTSYLPLLRKCGASSRSLHQLCFPCFLLFSFLLSPGPRLCCDSHLLPQLHGLISPFTGCSFLLTLPPLIPSASKHTARCSYPLRKAHCQRPSLSPVESPSPFSLLRLKILKESCLLVSLGPHLSSCFAVSRGKLFSCLASWCSSGWHSGPFHLLETLLRHGFGDLTFFRFSFTFRMTYESCCQALLSPLSSLRCRWSSGSVPANSLQSLHTLPWKPRILTDFSSSLCWGPNCLSADQHLSDSGTHVPFPH